MIWTARIAKPALREEADLPTRPATPSPREAAVFDAAWQAARPQIWRLTARISGSPDAADDLTQEVGLRALQALPRFRGDSDRRTYLYRIAVNVALRHKENSRRAGATESLDAPDGDAHAPCTADTPLSELLRAERLPRIRAALNALPDDLRTPLVLLVYEEMKYREIAGVLEIPIGTVMSRIHAARQRLRAALPEEFNDESL